jgi:hypothetical protein
MDSELKTEKKRLSRSRDKLHLAFDTIRSMKKEFLRMDLDPQDKKFLQEVDSSLKMLKKNISFLENRIRFMKKSEFESKQKEKKNKRKK